MENYREGQKEMHCVFVNLEKALHRKTRELWYCMKESEAVHDMYESFVTVVRCEVGVTDRFQVQVGLHHESALNPFMFAMGMDGI